MSSYGNNHEHNSIGIATGELLYCADPDDQSTFDALSDLASDLSRQLRGFSDYLDDAQHTYKVREDVLLEYHDE